MRFKQKLAIGLCTFYMLSVIGVALSMHFCGGKLASISLYSNKTACKLCKAEPVEKKDDGCCKNTKVDVKVKDSHQTESSFKLPKLFSIDTFLHPRTSEIVKRLLPSVFGRISNKAPPKSTRVAIHVFNCVFRN